MFIEAALSVVLPACSRRLYRCHWPNFNPAARPCLPQNRRRILEATELETQPGEIVAQGDASRLPPESFSIILHRPPVVVRADQRPTDLWFFVRRMARAHGCCQLFASPKHNFGCRTIYIAWGGVKLAPIQSSGEFRAQHRCRLSGSVWHVYWRCQHLAASPGRPARSRKGPYPKQSRKIR